MNKEINEQIKKEICDYMSEDLTVERCGLVVESGGFQRFFSCKNVHLFPKDNFMVDQKDYLIASMSGDIIAVVHSHTEKDIQHLSAFDRFAQYSDPVKWILYHPSIPGFLREYESFPKLKGREFEEGKLDCYDAFRDFYRLAGLEMGSYGPDEGYRVEDWHRVPGVESPYLQFIEKEGFERVPNIQDLQPGDVILSLLAATIPNHASIYVGQNKIFHHLPNRLSMVENLRTFYINYAHSFWRHKDVNKLKIDMVINQINEEI